MTTISPKRKRTAARFQFLAFSLLAVALIGTVFVAREPFANFLWWAGVPIAHTRDAIFEITGGFFAGLGSNQPLIRENNALRAALASSSAALLDRNLLYSENLELKSRLNRAPAGVRTTLAGVILRPPATPYDTLMIDAGKNAGAQIGDLVAAGGSAYIGRIAEVYDTASRVVLFSAPSETYDAILATAASSSLAISVSGKGGGFLTAEVPAATNVSVGDSILFPGIGVEFIARVVAVEESRTSFKTMYMQLPLNPSSLRFVEVRHLLPQ